MTRLALLAAAATVLLTGCTIIGWQADDTGRMGVWVDLDLGDGPTRWVGVGCIDAAPCDTNPDTVEQLTWTRVGRVGR